MGGNLSRYCMFTSTKDNDHYDDKPLYPLITLDCSLIENDNGNYRVNL